MPDAWNSKLWILHHDDNAPACSALSISAFLTFKNMPLVYNTQLHSPDSAPYDWFLFPRLKTAREGQSSKTFMKPFVMRRRNYHWDTLEEIQICLQKWLYRWKHCINGHYFQGNQFNMYLLNKMYYKCCLGIY